MKLRLDPFSPTGVSIENSTTYVGGGNSGIESIRAGTNVTVDSSDPKNPIVSSSGGGGGGGGQVNTVVAGTGIEVDSTDPENPVVSSTITQYSDENAQDAIGSILSDSSEIDFTYDDSIPSITASLIASSIDESKLDSSVNASLDLADSAVQNLGDLGITATSTELNYVDGVTSSIQTQLNGKLANTATTSDINEGSNLYFTNERAQDAVGTILTDTSTVDFTYNDAGNTISAAVLDSPSLNGQNAAYYLSRANHTGTQLSSTISDFSEAVQDAVGGSFTDTESVDFTYSDSGNSISARSSANARSVSQAAHGFVVGDVVRLNGSAYAKAQADTSDNAEVIGIVSSVTDTNNFVLTTDGYVTGLSGLTAGTVYFLSATTAGSLTSTEPTDPGDISKPVFVASSTSAGNFINYRGSEVSESSASTGIYNVKDYGALGDGSTDDRAAIQSANDAAEANGGGIVFYPPGTYILGSTTTTGVCIQLDASDVTHVGSGRGVSIVKLGNAVDAHMYAHVSTVGGGIKNLELDGNRTNQTGSNHPIRANGIDGAVFDGLYIHDASGYAIGLQDGTIQNLIIQNSILTNSGSDAIDVKNRNDDNKNNKISNVTVDGFGLNASLSTQAGIDLRGIWHVNNVDVRGFDGTSGSTGIRFREGELLDESGFAADKSNLTNFFIKADSTSGTVGIEINAKFVQISNGYITGCGTGLRANARDNVINGVIAEANVDGFEFVESTLPTNGDRCVANACTARTNTGDGFIIETDFVQLSNIISRSNNRGVVINSSAYEARISGEVSANTTAEIVDNGARTQSFDLINVGEWTSYSPTVTGFSANPTGVYMYKLIGKTCHLAIRQNTNGTSNATTFTISLPITARTLTNMQWVGQGAVINNGSVSATPGMLYIDSGGSTLTVARDWTDALAWTNSGNKRLVRGYIVYEIG